MPPALPFAVVVKGPDVVPAAVVSAASAVTL
jgi:hypothetical protein